MNQQGPQTAGPWSKKSPKPVTLRLNLQVALREEEDQGQGCGNDFHVSLAARRYSAAWGAWESGLRGGCSQAAIGAVECQARQAASALNKALAERAVVTKRAQARAAAEGEAEAEPLGAMDERNAQGQDAKDTQWKPIVDAEEAIMK